MWAAGFWTSVVVLVYAVVGFPLLVLARAVGRRERPPDRRDVTRPSVSVVIAARNEVACIAAKVERLLDVSPAASRLEVLVASDGSDDGTDEAVAAVDDARVRLLALPRAGKAAALNQAVRQTSGDVVVFTDANSWFADGALDALLTPFDDPEVGGVAGDQRYRPAGGAPDGAHGERAHWHLDRLLKQAESRAGSTISATGAIYAVRRELIDEVPPDVTDDFFISTGVIAAGRRLVFAPDAVAFEPVAGSSGREYARKVRIMTRGLTGVRRRAVLLDPRRSGFYAVQLLSHKVLRRLVVVPALTALVCAVPLARRRAGYRVVVASGLGFLVLGAAGTATRDRRVGRLPVLAVPAYVCMVNAAALRAGWNLVRGRAVTSWEPARR